MTDDKASGWKKNVGHNEKLKTKEQVEKEEVKKLEMNAQRFDDESKRGGDRYGGQRDNRGGRKEYNEKPSQ